MTTIEVRKKLGKIITNIFDENFDEKYQMIRPQAEHQTAEMMQAYEMSTDSYITLLSKNLNNQEMITHLNTIVELPAVYAMYMRYYLLSTILMEENPNREWNFPTAEKMFFKYVLIDLWKDMCIPKLFQEYHASKSPASTQE